MPELPVVCADTILLCQVSFGVRSRTHESLKLEAFRASGGTEASRIQVQYTTKAANRPPYLYHPYFRGTCQSA